MQHTTGAHPHARITLAALAATALAAIGLALGSASPALAHDELVAQEFTVDTDGQTDGILLQFNNNIMDVGTEILATDPAGNDVADGAPIVDGRDVTQMLVTPLQAGGPFEIAWRVVSSDGHPIQGIVYFEVAEDGSATIVDAGDEEHGDHDHSDEEHSHDADADADEAVTTDQEQGTGLHPAVLIAIPVVVIAAIWAIVAVVRRHKKKALTSDTPETEANDTEGGKN